MLPLSVQELAQKVANLNLDSEPYKYSMAPNMIVGEWKIADVKWAGLMAQGEFQKDYKITILLDESTHTYTFEEHKMDQEKQAGMDGSGKLSFGKSSSFFKGKTIGKQFGMGIGTSATNSEPLSQTYQYSFDTGKIKVPLFDLLKESGWTPKKKGLLSRIFSN